MHTQLPSKGQGISGCGLRVAGYELWVTMRVWGKRGKGPRLNISNRLVELGKNLTPVPSAGATRQAGQAGIGFFQFG